MRSNWKVLSLVLIAVTSIFLTLAKRGQSSSGQNRKPSSELQKRLDQLPVVDFNETNETDPVRRARNDRHNSHVSKEGVKKPKLSEAMTPILLDLPLSDQPSLPPFPMTHVVAIGTVQKVQAYLSSDRTSVYSEVTIAIEDVLKGNELVTAGLIVDAERPGGGVRFPSGKILHRGATGRNLPISGHRYLFFLNSIEGDESFNIVTGYELNDIVTPLDGTGEDYPEFKPYEKYRNASVSALLDEVKKAIARSSIGSSQ